MLLVYIVRACESEFQAVSSVALTAGSGAEEMQQMATNARHHSCSALARDPNIEMIPNGFRNHCHGSGALKPR